MKRDSEVLNENAKLKTRSWVILGELRDAWPLDIGIRRKHIQHCVLHVVGA